MESIEFNINNEAEVMLTEAGADTLNIYYQNLFAGNNQLLKHYPAYPYKSGDTVKTQLWTIMEIFGPKINICCQIPFFENKIKIYTNE